MMKQFTKQDEPDRLPQLSWGSLVSSIVAPILTALIVIALFMHTQSFAALNWDDQLHLLANPFIQPDSPDRYGHFWHKPYGQLFIPISYNVWAFVYATCFDGTGQFSATNLHRLNVFTHAMTAAAAWLLLRRLLREFSTPDVTDLRLNIASFLAALMFAFHPVQAESIAWISEFRGLLAGFFCVGTMIVHIRAGDALRFWKSILLEAAATTLFAGALMSKPSAAALPLMMAATDLLILRRPARSMSARLSVYVALAIACWLLTSDFQTSAAGAAGPLTLRPLVAADAVTFYLTKLIWPFALTTDYSRTPAMAASMPWFFLSWLVPIWIMALLVYRPNRAVLAASVLFLLAIAPVLGVLPFAFQRLSTVADRYLYLAMIAPAFLTGVMVLRRPRAIGAIILVIALLGWRCVDQTMSWKSDSTLWTHAARVNPCAVGAVANLADAAALRGERALARQLFDHVIAIDPHRPNGYLGNGRLLDEAGDHRAAVNWYQRAAEVDPTNPEPHLVLATAFLRLHEADRAEAHLRTALKLDPISTDALNNLGSLAMEKGQLDEAMALFDRAIEADPRHMQAWANRGVVHLKRGEMKSYLDSMNTAIRFAGSDTTPLRQLGKTALSRGEWTAARDCFERILKISPDDLDALNDLGQTLAITGEVDRAIAVFETALRLSPDSTVLINNLAAARRLKDQNAPASLPDIR